MGGRGRKASIPYFSTKRYSKFPRIFSVAAITSVFAVQFGHDAQFAAGRVVLTTLLSILFLPLCAFVITMG